MFGSTALVPCAIVSGSPWSYEIHNSYSFCLVSVVATNQSVTKLLRHCTQKE